MKRKITCTNDDGMSVTFGSQFSPYLLMDCDGIYTVQNRVAVSDNTMIDGGTYQGMVTSKRNIVLTIADKTDHQKNRYQLYQLFKPKAKGVFTYEENEDIKEIEYYVESVDITSTGNVRQATVSLICPNPYFESPYEVKLSMAGWKPLFEFKHEFFDEKEEFGTRIIEKLKTIDNDSGAEGIGITIRIYAIGPVTNPSITHVESGEFIKVGTSTKPLNMVSGDILTITTGTNNKKVTLFHGGETVEINEYLDENSDFIQLQSGRNSIGYDADAGDANITVELSYKIHYLGV